MYDHCLIFNLLYMIRHCAREARSIVHVDKNLCLDIYVSPFQAKCPSQCKSFRMDIESYTYWQSEFAYSFDHPSCKYFAMITYLTRVVYCLDMEDSPYTDLIIEAQLSI